MALPTTHGQGRLTADPELRFAPSGTAVATVPLAFNSRRKNERGEWEDGDTFFVRGKLFGDAAENACETYGRGTEVVVTGRLKTDQWQDKNTGEKRSATSLMIDTIGASTRYATATIAKTQRRESAPQAASGSFGATDDEPPF